PKASSRNTVRDRGVRSEDILTLRLSGPSVDAAAPAARRKEAAGHARRGRRGGGRGGGRPGPRSGGPPESGPAPGRHRCGASRRRPPVRPVPGGAAAREDTGTAGAGNVENSMVRL